MKLHKIILMMVVFCSNMYAKGTLEQRVSRLEHKNERLEQENIQLKRNIKTAETPSLQKGDFPGSYKISDTNTSFGLNAQLIVGLITDLDGQMSGIARDDIFPSFIPVPNGQYNNSLRKRDTHITGRFSRIGFKTLTPTPHGDLISLIEGDFYGSNQGASTEVLANNYGLRLRHAFIQWGRLKAGQSFTTLWDPFSYPESLNPNTGTGIGRTRQGLIRYTHPFDAEHKFALALALENPESDFMDETAQKRYTNTYDPTTAGNIGFDRVPDGIARLYLIRPWGGVSLGGITREIRILNPNVVSKATRGYGGAVALHLYTIGKDKFMFQVFGGNGIGRYIFDAAGQGAFYDSRTHMLSTQKSYGGYIAYQHWWADCWRSTLIGSAMKIHNNPFLINLRGPIGGPFPDVTRRTYAMIANILYTPVKDLSLGFEFVRAKRFTEDKRSGRMTRIQFGLKYIYGDYYTGKQNL